MTWEELKEKAKEMGYSVSDGFIYIVSEGNTGVKLCKNGDVEIDLTDAYSDYDQNVLIAEHRTPEQMLAIMKALQ